MATNFCFIWCTVVDALFGERFTLELGRLFLLVERGKSLGRLLRYAFFGPFGGKEIGEPLRIVNVQIIPLKVPFCIYFGIV